MAPDACRRLGAVEAHRRHWETLAGRDPLWAILTDPSRKDGGWEIGEFLATGEREVERLMELTGRLGVPAARSAALDYGCGVGRITRALASRFDTVVGLDISTEMVSRAAALNGDLSNARFQLTSGVDLEVVGTGRFDLVYCFLVLQHVPSHRLIEATIGRLAEVVAPGGLLAFQLPGPLLPRQRVQGRRRLFAVLRRLGVPDEVLLGRLGLTPMRMTGIRHGRVRELLDSLGLRVLEVHATDHDGIADSFTYYVTTK